MASRNSNTPLVDALAEAVAQGERQHVVALLSGVSEAPVWMLPAPSNLLWHKASVPARHGGALLPCHVPWLIPYI